MKSLGEIGGGGARRVRPPLDPPLQSREVSREDYGNEIDSINAEATSKDTSNHSAGEEGPFIKRSGRGTEDHEYCQRTIYGSQAETCHNVVPAYSLFDNDLLAHANEPKLLPIILQSLYLEVWDVV